MLKFIFAILVFEPNELCNDLVDMWRGVDWRDDGLVKIAGGGEHVGAFELPPRAAV